MFVFKVVLMVKWDGLICSDEVMSLHPPLLLWQCSWKTAAGLMQTRHESVFLIRSFGDDQIFNDHSSEHQKPFCCATLCVSVAAEQNDVITGLIRARPVTMGDVSHGSCPADGLTVCYARSMSEDFSLFSFFHLAPCMESLMLSSLSWWFFFLSLVPASAPVLIISHLSLPFMLSLCVLWLPLSHYGWVNFVSVIKSSRPLCGGMCLS